MIPKFRAWHKKEKKMYYSTRDIRHLVIQHPLNKNNNITCAYLMMNLDGALFAVVTINDDGVERTEIYDVYEPEWIKEQSIGLKDKTGQEIFEGDILKVESYGGIEIIEVKWLEEYAGFEFYRISDGEICPLTDYTDMMGFDLNAEVIGNIYENPELLEVKP